MISTLLAQIAPVTTFTVAQHATNAAKMDPWAVILLVVTGVLIPLVPAIKLWIVARAERAEREATEEAIDEVAGAQAAFAIRERRTQKLKKKPLDEA